MRPREIDRAGQRQIQYLLMAWTLDTNSSLNKIGYLILLMLWGVVCLAEPKSSLVVNVHSKQFGEKELQKIEKALGIVRDHPVDRAALDRGIRALFSEGGYQTLLIREERTKQGIVLWISGQMSLMLFASARAWTFLIATVLISEKGSTVNDRTFFPVP